MPITEDMLPKGIVLNEEEWDSFIAKVNAEEADKVGLVPTPKLEGLRQEILAKRRKKGPYMCMERIQKLVWVPGIGEFFFAGWDWLDYPWVESEREKIAKPKISNILIEGQLVNIEIDGEYLGCAYKSGLKPCPMCGSLDLGLVEFPPGSERHDSPSQVCCKSCGCTGPLSWSSSFSYKELISALELWDRQADSFKDYLQKENWFKTTKL
jgi:hypothetical protein